MLSSIVANRRLEKMKIERSFLDHPRCSCNLNIMAWLHQILRPAFALKLMHNPAHQISRKMAGLIYGAILGMLMVNSLQAREFRIGVLYWSTNIAGQVAMAKGLETEAVKINEDALLASKPTIKLEIQVAGDGEDGIKRQIGQMHKLIDSQVDLIIVQPTDNAALAGPLKAANKAKIPVVAYDQYISGGQLTAYRTSDNYLAGFLDGEYIASLFPSEKEIHIVLVEYPHVSSTVERVNGFLDALSQMKQRYEILKSYSAVEPISGRKAAQDILRDFPKAGGIDVVFTVNDGGGLEVVNGLANAGRNEIIVATIDGDPESVNNIQKQRLTVIDSAQFCGPLGAEALKTAYAILMGEKPMFHVLVPVFPVTRETMDQYPGWLGPIPKPFQKPWKSDNAQWDGQLKAVKP